MSEKPDGSELEKVLGKDTSQIAPAVKEIILLALKKSKRETS